MSFKLKKIKPTSPGRRHKIAFKKEIEKNNKIKLKFLTKGKKNSNPKKISKTKEENIRLAREKKAKE